MSTVAGTDSQSDTMKAVVLTETQGEYKPGKVFHPISVQDVPIPKPAEGEVLVKVKAAAYNHRDLFIRQSLYPGVIFPSILGSDALGTVVSPTSHPLHNKSVLIYPAVNWDSSPIGPDVPGKQFGILGGTKPTEGRGTFAEYIAVKEGFVVEAPKHLVEDGQRKREREAAAAAIPLGSLTAFRATFTKGQVQKGQNVLITGIGGGVAVQALQFCVAAGANVWVTSGSEEKIKWAVGHGAKGGLNYKDEKWPKTLPTLLPKDRPYLDVVIDSAGGPIATQAGRALKDGGIIVCYGSTTGKEMPITMAQILKNIEFKGSTMGSLAEFKDALKFIADHRIEPVVHKVLSGLDQSEEGFEIMKSASQAGKIVILVESSSDGGKGKL